MKNTLILTIFLIFTFLVSSIYSISIPTLKDQIGQMLMVGFDGTKISNESPITQEIKNYRIGGVILFDHENGKARNINNPKQLKELTTALQKYAKKNNVLPLFISIDQEGGLITNLKEKKRFKLRSNLSEKQLGKYKQFILTENQAYNQGVVMKAAGINLNYSPVVDLAINQSNPAIAKLQRSFGINTTTVIGMSKAMINGYHKAGIMCTLKHFPGLGSASSNTDFITTDVTHSWSRKELIPYKQLIKINHPCLFIMVTHLINKRLDPSGSIASLSKIIVTNLLRKKLNFKGLIISDNLDAKAITHTYTIAKAVRKALLAGNDIIMIAGTEGANPYKDATIAFNTIYKLAQSSKDLRQQIKLSYDRVEAAKSKYFKQFIS